MAELETEIIAQWVAAHLWPLFRIASFLMVIPIVGTNLVPMRVRFSLALLMTFVLVPTLPAVPALDPLSLSTVAISLEQIAIGVFLGMTVQMLFQLFIIAGQMMAMQMGLGFASMVDPANGITVTGLSQFYVLLTTLVFLAMNGHLVIFEVLAESFRFMPIGGEFFEWGHWWHLATRINWMFVSALMISLPAITALLVVNFSLGVMTRAAPQMNIFSIGFPLTVVLGIFVFYISTGYVLPQFDQFSEETFAFMWEALGAAP